MNESATAKEPVVARSMNQLGEAIAHLEVVVGDLISRLTPVINNQPRATGEDTSASPAPSKCLLACSLDSMRSSVGDITQHVNGAISNLEL